MSIDPFRGCCANWARSRVRGWCLGRRFRSRWNGPIVTGLVTGLIVVAAQIIGQAYVNSQLEMLRLSVSNSSEIFSKRLEAYSVLVKLSGASYIPDLIVPEASISSEERIVASLETRAKEIGAFLEAYAGFVPDDVANLTIEAGGLIKGYLWEMEREPLAEIRLLRLDHAYRRSSSKLVDASHRMKRYVSHLAGEQQDGYVPDELDRSTEFLENDELEQRENELRAAAAKSLDGASEDGNGGVD